MITEHFSVPQIRKLAATPHLIGRFVGKTKLTPMHSDWMKRLWLPQRHTALQAHRGAYKTTACTELGVIWWLLFHPNDRIALIRETWTVAADTLKTIALYMQDPKMMELFRAVHGRYPKMTTCRDGRIVFQFKASLTREGSIDAYGVDQVPVGSHYDVILLDDVVSMKDRFSKSKREKTIANVQEIMTNILDPGKFLRSVGTPWHKEDAHEIILPKALKYDVYSTGILTPDQIEDKKKLTSKVMFAANYLLQHISDDMAMFTDPGYADWPWTSRQMTVAHLDAAYGGEDTNAMTFLKPGDGQDVHIHGKSWAGHCEKLITKFVDELEGRGARYLYIEDNADKKFLAKLIRAECLKRGVNCYVKDYHESTNKHAKIGMYVSRYWSRLRFTEDTDPEYLGMVCEYQEGQEPDDAPDSLASILRQVLAMVDPNMNSTRALYEA